MLYAGMREESNYTKQNWRGLHRGENWIAKFSGQIKVEIF